MHSIRNLLIVLATTSFLFIGSIGMLSMSDHSHGQGCPFMPGEQVMCQMDVFDHISAWQSAFTAILPVVLSMAFLLFMAVVVWRYFKPPDIFVRHKFVRSDISLFSVDIVQQLFASHILNPRAP